MKVCNRRDLISIVIIYDNQSNDFWLNLPRQFSLEMEKGDLQIRIGMRIKHLRQKKGLSQQELASLCDFEKSNMARLEGGNTNPTIFTLYKISLALDCKLSELTALTNPG